MDHARFPDRIAREVRDVRRGADAIAALDTEGFWALVVTFEGEAVAVRFDEVRPIHEVCGRGDGPVADHSMAPTRRQHPAWASLEGPWDSSLDEAEYRAGVTEIRRRIATGEVYQVNLCRVLTHELGERADLDALDGLLRVGNPAPHAVRVRCVAADLDIACASPELFLRRADGVLTTRPIKGTAPTAGRMLPKDRAENVMIVDLMRNDLSPVCRPGTVRVDALCATETHPGLVHLVSTVRGQLRADASWAHILAVTTPPGSVSGAPKSSALAAIGDLEPEPRGPYCGAIGWVDADRGSAELAVGIRTFWATRDAAGRRLLRFGTGAGITWGSDPAGEWAETALKATRLVGLASGAPPGTSAILTR